MIVVAVRAALPADVGNGPFTRETIPDAVSLALETM